MVGDLRGLMAPDLAAAALHPASAEGCILAMHHRTAPAAQMAEEIVEICARVARAVEAWDGRAAPVSTMRSGTARRISMKPVPAPGNSWKPPRTSRGQGSPASNTSGTGL